MRALLAARAQRYPLWKRQDLLRTAREVAPEPEQLAAAAEVAREFIPIPLEGPF